MKEEAWTGLHQLLMEKLREKYIKALRYFSLDILEKVVHLPGNRRGRKIFPFVLWI